MTQNPFPLPDAQVQATLAAIAYAGDMEHHANPSIDALHAAISHQLSCKPHYATAQNWHLVWGPIESPKLDNLIYAAFDPHSQTLSIVIRGTTTQTWSRFEDIPFSQSLFPAGNTSQSAVSSHFLEGLKSVLNRRDKWHQQTLSEFFTSFGQQVPIHKITVTGHSQGAALVPMMMLALRDGLVGAPKVSQALTGFAVAPPTSGNPQFAQCVDAQLDCWFIINPLDVVPLGYNRMNDVVTKGIPEMPNILELPGITAAIAVLDGIVDLAGTWAQPTQQATLPEEHLLFESFFDQIGGQHNHNTYLHLLGAHQTDVGDPSPINRQSNPVIHT